MGTREVKEHTVGRGRHLSPSGGKLVLFVLASGLAGISMSMPRPVVPDEPPSLTLDRHDTSRVLAHDRMLASRVPKSEAVLSLMQLVADQGTAEAGPGEAPGSFEARMAKLHAAVARVRRDDGNRALAAMRAHAAERLRPALDGEMTASERDALIGSFPEMLERYGLVVEGETVAPPFVVRTLFKARWNALVGLPPTSGLWRVERRAYWGWLALHASNANPDMRLDALTRYARSGGTRIDEARAVLEYRAGRVAEAAELMARAARERGGLRLRNEALALLQ